MTNKEIEELAKNLLLSAIRGNSGPLRTYNKKEIIKIAAQSVYLARALAKELSIPADLDKFTNE
jgi:hypothetical protein